jgi:hypothetical protein
MSSHRRSRAAAVLAAALLALGAASRASAQVPTPEQFFGFKIGTDGELATYAKELEYFQLLAARTDRVKFEELGKTTLGHPYVLVTISAPQNLKRLNRLVEINHKLADPRTTSEAEATALTREGRPFYLLKATIHSNEVGNGQAIVEIAHRLATDASPETREILDNLVLLLVPSQNPDGQYLLIDQWYKNKGTSYSRNYPDLYHVYTGHDDNRDWFLISQKETQLIVGKVLNAYLPVITQDMHEQGTNDARIYVPPFDEPYDANIDPIIAREHAEIGSTLASALIADGKSGVTWGNRYDMWSPARQYEPYHGNVRILTEIAASSFADPYVNPAGKDRPLGPQQARLNFPVPYTSGTWTLGQIVDYGVTATFAGLTDVARNHVQWLKNFYTVQRNAVTWDGKPYAFVVPANQRDPFATYHLLDALKKGAVEIHQARAAFTADGRSYDAGAYVIKVAQPFGRWAKTLLEKQVYPDLRQYPGGPPKQPYDTTAQTLGYLLGVDVQAVETAFDAPLSLVTDLRPAQTPVPASAQWAYVFGPESNAGFVAAAKLQTAHVPLFRTASATTSGGRTWAPGTWIVPPTPQARQVLVDVARDTGLAVASVDRPFDTAAFALKPETRIGLWRGAGNSSGGWLKWLFEQYGLNHDVVKADDFKGELSARYDAIVLPDGTSRNTIVNGLNVERYGPDWAWAAGVGEAGWGKLAEWVENGGTLVAIGSAVETTRQLFDLPIASALPQGGGRGGGRGGAAFGGRGAVVGEGGAPAAAGNAGRQGGAGVAGGRGRGAGPGAAGVGGGRAGAAGAGARGGPAPADASAVLREAFSSPASLASTLTDRVIEPRNLFYCPGALLENEFDTAHPVGFGLPASWPIFFESNQAYRLLPSFTLRPEVVARYPGQGEILRSGWLLGDQYLRNAANVIAFRVGKGYVVTIASEATFRAQPEATFKLVFNSIFHGPSTAVSAADLRTLATKEVVAR